MVSVQHPKPLGTKQESTNYDFAASELSYPQCSIINAVSLTNKEKGYAIGYFLLTNDYFREFFNQKRW